jgi:cyclopropane fatty-acyl-phospholipid synthase-like methyltransferase
VTDSHATDIRANLADILDRFARGSASAPVTLMQLLIETEDFEAARAAVLTMARNAAGRDVSAQLQSRSRELVELLNSNAAGCERVASMLRADVDSAKPARSIEEGIAFCERLFDWSVQQSEEASVALYSLGNPDLLNRATAEIVEQLDKWGLLTRHTDLLDIGCGIGRLLIPLADKVRNVTGIDVSAEMVKVARRRTASHANVTVIKGDGRGLGDLRDGTFDVAIAVDSFPYLRQSGYELVRTFVSESARVLRPRGQLIILNYSYSEDDDGDAKEVQALARQNGFEVLDTGVRPFQLWDGVAFRLLLRASS